MSVPLSKKTNELLSACFGQSDIRNHLASRLEHEVAENLGSTYDPTPESLERLRFSVIRLVVEDPDDIENVFYLAKLDWRDLLMNAGHGRDIEAHETWCEAVLKGQLH